MPARIRVKSKPDGKYTAAGEKQREHDAKAVEAYRAKLAEQEPDGLVAGYVKDERGRDVIDGDGNRIPKRMTPRQAGMDPGFDAIPRQSTCAEGHQCVGLPSA